MKVVVTGGAGFIGANLCRALAADAAIDHVVAFDDLSTGREPNLHGVDGVELVVGSILDTDAIGSVLDGADAVVHLAARPSVPLSVADPVRSHEVNATGTVRVLESVRAAGSPYVVVASSSSVYGANPTLPKREDATTMPLSPYAVSKLATEAYALAYAECFSLDVLAFRFFNVFGPLQPADHAYAAVVPSFLGAVTAGQPLTIFGDGLQSRDFTYVDSVAEVITDAVRRRVVSRTPVNLAFGTSHTVLDLVHELESVLGHPLQVVHADPRPGDVRHSQADQSRLRELFPRIAPASLRDGLERTVAWFRSLT